MKLKHDVRLVARRFQIHGAYQGAAPYGSGHINDTYCAVFDQAGTSVRYIFQRINHNIFKNPVRLMDNIRRVIAHLAGKGEGDRSTTLPTASNRSLQHRIRSPAAHMADIELASLACTVSAVR